MRVLLVFVGLVALAAAVSPPRFVARRRDWDSVKKLYTCPSNWVPGSDKGEGFPPGDGAKATWDGSKKEWHYNKGVINAEDGVAYSDDTKPLGPGIDMCKIQPKEICKHDGSADFCIKTKAAACCPKMSGGECKASGLPRKWMPQLIDNRFASPPQPDSLTKSYDAFKVWAGKVWSGFDYDDKEVETKNLMPTQDEIFWTKSINKICFKPGSPSAPAVANSPPTGTPVDPPFVGSDNYIIDGHHRWSQAALCPLVVSCTGGAKIKVRSTKVATGAQIVDTLTQFAKVAWKADTKNSKRQFAHNKEKDLISVDKDTDAFVSFDAFVEVDAAVAAAVSVFGRSAVASRAEAVARFVEMTRNGLASIGMELKGGDSAIAELFEMHYAPHLWN